MQPISMQNDSSQSNSPSNDSSPEPLASENSSSDIIAFGDAIGKAAEQNAAPAVSITNQARLLCEAFGRAVDMRDGRGAGHSRDVAYYACLIGQEMELSEQEVGVIEAAAMLHGIGKLAVPDTLLHKTSALTTGELAQIHDALIAGALLVRAVPGFEGVADIVRHQGERWDGTGSPDGLLHEEIPLGARILAVALRFAAMTRPRADRPALSVVGGALEFLAYEAGIALDPNVVRAFLAAMGRDYSGK